MNLEELLQRTEEKIAAQQRLPEATYRLQFHAGFTFRDAEAIVPYLHQLGITHCYASPYLQARQGSQHGYDITNHRVLNAEIGTQEDFEAWVAQLHAHRMGQILDVVPNHMGIVGNANAWWNDVLENGPLSPYANYFDIAWEDSPRSELHNRVLLPVLGHPYGEVLEAGQLQLVYDGSVGIQYFDHRFPLHPRSIALILQHQIDELEKMLGADSPAMQEYHSIVLALLHLPQREEKDPQKIIPSQREKEVIKRRLLKLIQEHGEIRDFLNKTIARFNGQPGQPESFDLLDQLLDQQVYRLSYWRVASDEINYRRFFDINELAALNMERPEVFTATHEFVLSLLSRGKIDGVRIDHPDGLYDPRQYFQRLQQHYLLACAKEVFHNDPALTEHEWEEVKPTLLNVLADRVCTHPLYVVVEKILGNHEELPGNWPTSGTSGYDFMFLLNNLFVDRANEQIFQNLYHDWLGDDLKYSEVVYQSKFQTLHDALSSELHMLGRQLDRIAQRQRNSRDFTQNSLRFALRQLIACFPVYRSYIADEQFLDMDRQYVEMAVRRAIKRSPTTNRSIFRFIRDLLLLKNFATATDQEKAEQLRFVGKFQQVTSPVTAKGVEDTAFYIFNRLVSLNEVGGDPSRFGVTPEFVHRSFQKRQQKWAQALSPLSTHDAKRSEDVRARLNVLSEIPNEWQERLYRWRKRNEPLRVMVDETPVPDANEEYLLYQTLLGAWPIEPCSPHEWKSFVKRIQAYMLKCLHEAKVHSSWINPNETYDEALSEFVARVLNEEQNTEFLHDFREFQKRLSHLGMLNSLAQTLLRITAPGVPDTYQGTELWDFSLVDPDNRRPVDYAKRHAMLQQLDERSTQTDLADLTRELLATKEDGRIKLYVTAWALRYRRAHPGLFSHGEYVPAEVTGANSEHIFAFGRRHGSVSAIVVVPRLLTKLLPNPFDLPLGGVWDDTYVAIPGFATGQQWRDLFTGQTITNSDAGTFPLQQVFATFPSALLINESVAQGEEVR